jgi:VWFA-related protein
VPSCIKPPMRPSWADRFTCESFSIASGPSGKKTFPRHTEMAKGEFVHDLTAKDFRIWQDGKEQAITSLSLESKSTEPHFLVLFFDGSGMALEDQSRARQAVSRFIDANAAPVRLMAVASFDGSLRVAQNFTDNAARLKDAMKRMEMGSFTTTAKPDSFGSRNMLQALANLAKSLGVLPGRKTVVLLTGGIPASSELKSEVASGVQASSGVAIYPVNLRLVSVDSVDVGKLPTAWRPIGQPTLRGVEDSTPLTQDPAGSSQPLLLSLANGTGGFFIPKSVTVTVHY